MSGKILLPFFNDILPYSPLGIPTIEGKAIYSGKLYHSVAEWQQGKPSSSIIERVGYKTRIAQNLKDHTNCEVNSCSGLGIVGNFGHLGILASWRTKLDFSFKSLAPH